MEGSEEWSAGNDWDLNVPPIKEVDSARCIEKLKQIGEVRNYSKGELIVDAQDCRGVCFIVLEGVVTARVVTESGVENQYIAHEAGAAGLEAQCFCEWREAAMFQAAEPTRALLLNRAELLAAMEKDFELVLFFIGTISLKFRWYVEHARNLSVYGAMRRCCDLLIDLAGRYGSASGGKLLFCKKISQEEIGKQLHVNRLTVIRCMKELKDKGLVETEDGYICIRDLAALKTFRAEV